MSDFSVGPILGVKFTSVVSNSQVIDSPIVVSDPEMNDSSVVSNSVASVPVILNSEMNVHRVVSNPSASTSNVVLNTSVPVKKIKKKKPKEKIPSCFRHYLQIEKAKENTEDASLELENIVEVWVKTPGEEKHRFLNMSTQEKVKLCKSSQKIARYKNPEVKAKVKVYDSERKKTDRKDMKIIKQDEEYCSEKFKSILYKAEEKYFKLVHRNTELESELTQLSSQKGVLDKLLNDKESSLRSYKSKFKILYEQHQLCKKKL